MLPELNPTYVALFTTLFGASGLKIVEHFLSKKKSQNDDATIIRTELRSEVEKLRELINKTEAEVDEWRNKYYTLLNEVAQLRAEAAAAAALARLKAAEADRLAAQAEVLAATRPDPPKKRAPRRAAPKKEVENDEGE